MAEKISKQRKIENAFVALLNLYITEHGGIENNAYLGMLWMSGRIEELAKEFDKRQLKVEMELKAKAFYAPGDTIPNTDWIVMEIRESLDEQKQVILCRKRIKEPVDGYEWATWRVSPEGERFWGHYWQYSIAEKETRVAEILKEIQNVFQNR